MIYWSFWSFGLFWALGKLEAIPGVPQFLAGLASFFRQDLGILYLSDTSGYNLFLKAV